MNEKNHEVLLTIFRSSRATADPDPAQIELGAMLRWKVLFDEGDGNPPGPEGPKVEIRFTDRASGPFSGLHDEYGAIAGRGAEKRGLFNYHVFLEGRDEPLPWSSGRNFGGVDVGGPPRSR